MQISKKNLKRLIERLIKEDRSHTIQSGETASGIAQRYNITLTQLRDANPDVSNLDSIRAGDTLAIPDEENSQDEEQNVDGAAADNQDVQGDDIITEGYTLEEHVIACTLCAEVGSHRSVRNDTNRRLEVMQNVYTVIHNRARDGKFVRRRGGGIINTDMSRQEVCLDSAGGVFQFSFWTEMRSEDQDPNNLRGSFLYWQQNVPNIWQEALDIARDEDISADVGNSKFYYAPAVIATPGFANTNIEPCWQEVHNDRLHIFGLGGRPWYNCVWGWVDQQGGDRWVNRGDGEGRVNVGRPNR